MSLLQRQDEFCVRLRSLWVPEAKVRWTDLAGFECHTNSRADFHTAYREGIRTRR
jgi:hypothetical protein